MKEKKNAQKNPQFNNKNQIVCVPPLVFLLNFQCRKTEGVCLIVVLE